MSNFPWQTFDEGGKEMSDVVKQVQIGKRYRRRDGTETQPLVYRSNYTLAFDEETGMLFVLHKNEMAGSCQKFTADDTAPESDHDLMEELP